MLANSRKDHKQELSQAEPLRNTHPRLAEVRVEFNFEDGTLQPPSRQSFAYFPAARSLFRYPCPCHGCDGTFDLNETIADLAGSAEPTQLVRHLSVVCPGQRLQGRNERAACPIHARIHISAIPRS